jgi:CheY-like chemotaxis protein
VPTPNLERPRRLLIIEDDADTRDALRLLLQAAEVAIEAAADAPAGLERARRWRPHVVLLDMRLGGAMSGYEAFLDLRRGPFAPRVILMSAGPPPAELARAGEHGVYAFLAKPFAETFPATVRRALDLPAEGAARAERDLPAPPAR